MRKNPLLTLALTGAALLLGAGPALADGHVAAGTTSEVRAQAAGSASAVPAATGAPSRARQSATPVPSATGAPSRARQSATPVPAPTSTGGQQVSAVPQGAPDTGVPASAGGDSNGVITGALAAGVVALGGVGVVVMRRRAKVRG